jgi:hypothetical protein
MIVMTYFREVKMIRRRWLLPLAALLTMLGLGAATAPTATSKPAPIRLPCCQDASAPTTHAADDCPCCCCNP